MALQVRAYLTFCFGQKSQIPFVAQCSSQCAKRQRSRIPERVEQTQASAQLIHTVRSPGQMFGLLPSRVLEFLLNQRITRSECLPLIQGLGAYLAGMVDAHQRGRVLLFRLAPVSYTHLTLP